MLKDKFFLFIVEPSTDVFEKFVFSWNFRVAFVMINDLVKQTLANAVEINTFADRRPT